MDILYLEYADNVEKSCISVGDLNFSKIDSSRIDECKIISQAEGWEICVYNEWYYENLSYNDIKKGKSTKRIAVKDIVNMNGRFSSEDVTGAVLIENSEFAGVIIRLDSQSGFGMSESLSEDYCILKINGEIIGKASKRSGHCSTEVDEWSDTSYSLNYNMNYWTQSNKNIFVAAHRGFCAKFPENTMTAFREAIKLGVDQIETDVRITKDNELVLIHDSTLDRTTNGSGKVCDYTLAELKMLDAGNGEQIPTLRELFELVKDHPTMTLDLEFKEYPVDDWEERAFYTCDKILAMVEEYSFAERCVINSFNQKLNEYIYKKYNGRYKQHLFFPESVLQTEDCELPVYSFGYCACVFKGDLTIDEIKRFGEKTGIRIWAPASTKDEASIDVAMEYGAELITCNNPDEVLEILRRKGVHK